MGTHIHSKIAGTGSFIPTRTVENADFLRHDFRDTEGKKFERANEEIIQKFEAITGISERRYLTDDLTTSDMATHAAKDALESSKIDKESLDYLIVAHNFGDVAADNRRSDFVPSIAARVKHRLQIENPSTVAYDLVFGCPGWLQAMIQVDYYIKSGDARRALVIGAEALSRVSDAHDRDSMIYADGAGATIVESVESEEPVGIISHCSRSDAREHAYMLHMGPSYGAESNHGELFLKMQGHKLYEYALRTVPHVVKQCLSNAGIALRDVSKVLIHQANAKMDEAILERLYGLFGDEKAPRHTMPMTISWLGNSSVATLPTLFDLLVKGRLENHRLAMGDTIVFASVGAGMNINAMVYKMA